MDAMNARLVALDSSLKDICTKIGEATKRGAGYILELRQLKRDTTWYERLTGNYPFTKTTKNLIEKLKNDGYNVECKLRYGTKDEAILVISW